MRKKRVFVKRDETEVAPVIEEAAEAGGAGHHRGRVGRARRRGAQGAGTHDAPAGGSAEEARGASPSARSKKEEEEVGEGAAAAAAEEAAKVAEARAAAAAAAPAPRRRSRRKRPPVATEGTLHRPAAKPGEKARPAKRTSATAFQEEAARRRALKLRGDVTGGAATAGMAPAQGRRAIATTRKAAKAQRPLAGAVMREITIPETISVAELAHKMSVKAAEVIKALMKMGQMVTINQVLDQETAMILVEEMGHKAKAAKLDDLDALIAETQEGAQRRSRAASAGGHGHGSRRPRQDVAARLDSPRPRGERRGRRHHPAHRRVSRRDAEGRDHVPRHAGPRGIHGNACARRQGHRHRRAGRRGR